MIRFFGRAVLWTAAVALIAPVQLFAATGEYRAAVLADAPVAYYPLDETTGGTAGDISGNGRHGTYNAVTLGASGALGSATKAATFNGSNSYIQLPGTWGGTAEGTIEAWINVAATTGTAQAIVSATTPTYAQLQTISNTLFYKQDTTSVSLDPVPENIGTWTHVALVMKSGASTLYINGVVSGSTSVATFTTILSSGDVRIGQGAAPGRYFNGRIDEVAIYDTALSQAQLQDHIAAQSDGPFISAGSGNWSSAANWTNGRVPTFTDDVTINGGHTITVDVASLTVNSLVVLGTVDTSSFGLTVTKNLTVAGTINGTSNLTLSGTTGSQLIGLGVINAPVLFDTGSREIPVGESPDFTNFVTANGGVTNNGEATLTSTSGLGGTGTWTQGANSVLHIEGSISVNSFSATASGNTVDFTGSGQSVRSGTYHHLTTTGAGETRTLTGAVTANGNLTVDGTLDMNGHNVAVTGNISGSGTIDLQSSVFVSGTLSLQGNNTSFSGSVTPQYDITFTGGNAQSIRGTTYSALNINKSGGTATLAGNATATFINLDAGTLSDGGFTLSSGGTIDLAAGTTLRISATMPAGTHITDPASNVYYEANGNQPIAITPLYGNLFITTGTNNALKSLDAAGTLNARTLTLTNGTGTVTLDASGNTVDVADDLSGNGTLNISGGSLNIGGDFLHTGTFTATGSTVTYDGSGAQSVRGTAYNALLFNKSGGTATFAGNASVAGLLDINTGTLALSNRIIDTQGFVEIDGTIDLGTGILKAAGNLNINGTLTPGLTGAIWLTGSTVQQWTGTASALTLNNLVIDGAGGMNVQSGAGYDITVTSTLNLSGGGGILLNTPRKLTIASTGTLLRTAGAIRGLLAMQIPAGQTRRYETATYTSNTYSPIEITSASAATVNVFVTDSAGTQKVDRVWTLSGDPSTLDLKYEWVYTGYTGDTRGFVPARFASSTWSFPAGYVDVSGAPNYFAEVNGVIAYDGDWTAGYAAFLGNAVPSIGSFDPDNGATGTAVTIYGSSFTGTTAVSFNGTAAPGFSTNGDHEIFATVPAGATTGKISVTNASGTGQSFNNFTIATPVTIQTAQSGNWSSPSTWQGGTVPNSWDTAVINHTVTVDTNVTIDDVQVNANLTGASTLSVNNSMTWNSGSISAPLFIFGGATVTVAGAGSHVFDGNSVQNAGTIDVTGNDLLLANGANLTSSGDINLSGDVDLIWNAAGATPTIYNSGNITKTGGSGSSFLGGGASLTTIDTIAAASGSLQITSALVTANPPSSGISVHAAVPKHFTVSNGATMQFSGGATFIDGSTFSGSGTILITSAATFSGTITSSATSFLIDANANTTWTAATFNGGTLTWKQSVFTGTLTLGSGTIAATTSGGDRRMATLAFTNNGVFNLASASVTVSDSTTISNNGTIDFQGDYNLAFDSVGTAPTITNGNVITKTAGTLSLISSGINLTSTAMLRSQSGTLRIQAAATVSGTVDGTNAGNKVEFPSSPTFNTGTTFTGNGGVLINSGATFNGSLTQTSTQARIDTTSTVTFNAASISGTMEWKDATFTGTGLTIIGGSVIDVLAGAGNVTLSALSVVNNGTLELGGAGVALQNGASFDNQFIVDIQGDHDFRFNGTGGAGSIANSGTIKKTLGAGTSVLGNGATLTSSGTVQATNGILSVSSAITTAGTFNAGSGATVAFPSTATFNSGTTFTGLGTIDVAGNATFAGTITGGGGTTMLRGTASTMTFNAATFSGALTWKEASIAGSGLTIPNGSLLTVVSGGSTPRLDAGSLTINGTMTVNTGLGFRNGGSFTLANGATLDIAGDHSFGYDGTGALPLFSLNGNFGKTAGSGTANVSCGGVCTNTATGLIASAAGTLAFVSGLTNNGTLAFDINGPVAGTDFGIIAVGGGTLTLTGSTATATVDPAYVPGGGTPFQVLTFTSRTGDFATKNYTFAGTRTLIDSYGVNDLTLTASGPSVGSLSPTSGTTAGGTSVTINGSGFTGTTPGESYTGTVFFGGTQAPAVIWQSATQLTATTPAHSAGTVNVVVTNVSGESHTAVNAFTFTAPVATVDVTTTADSGAGSLRDAINKANSGVCTPNCTITFSIGTGLQTITPLTPLPSITASGVTIDGTTQEGFAGTPLIGISGSTASGQNAQGLVLAGGSATVKSLLIRDFTDAYPYGYAIHITSAGNSVKGCYLGINATGTAVTQNRVGIVIDGAAATGNTIGGTTAADRNVISGNDASGISIENGASSNTVLGNYIGTDPSGAVSMGNAFNGINIEGATNNIIGGSTAAARNVISANVSPNVLIGPAGTTGNVVKGNYIGINAAGTAAMGNGDAGVYLHGGASSNTIGGSSAGEGNVVSGNASDGILLDGAGTSNNIVAGNLAGLNAAGTAAVANTFSGIAITGGASGNTIGGSTAGARNVVSGNTTQGIAILDPGTNNNVVKGNYCGLNPSGTAAIPNGFHGIAIWNGAQSNTIGGISPSDRNVSSGNTFSGIAIDGASNNTVAGNLIGRNAADTANIPNAIHGIELFGGAAGNTIGGPAGAAANRIAGHTGSDGINITDAGTSSNLIQNNVITGNGKGVALTTTAGPGNRISQNQISGNTSFGIDLDDDGFVLANDPTDSDTGPNNRQNFPLLANAVLNGSTLTVDATINSSGSAAGGLVLELFKADASAPEQALLYLGSTGCLGTTLAGPPISMTVAGLAAGDELVATATSYNAGCTTVQDGTSELSAAVPVSSPSTAVSITKTAPASVVVNQTFTYTITVTNSGPGAATSVTVGDVIQAGMSASNISAPSFSCSGTTTLNCTAASLAAGSHTITFDVTAPSTPQAISNVANLSASNDSTGGDNTSTAVTNVGSASADLAVTTAPGSGSVAVGSSMTWTVTVTNNGPSTASSVVITDTLPAGQTVTNTAPSAGSCGVSGSVVTCNVGSIASGNSASVVITVTAVEGGTRMNQATAAASEPDPNNTNDVGTATVIVTGDSILVVTSANPSGTGTLSQAILDANAGYCPAPCTIQFAIQGLTTISAAQPAVTVNQLTIDATTQPGYAAGSPVVALDGSIQNPGTHGLVVQGSGAVIKGLSISAFTDGIRVQGAGSRILDNVLFNNVIGVSILSPATAVRVLGNSIHSNAGLPIDHDADGVVELLDAGDPDIGANNQQNAPVISQVEITPGGLDVTFSVDSGGVPSTQGLFVELFKTDGSGEPQTRLGGQCFAGNNLVNQLITVPIGSVVAGNTIVATATSYTDNACTLIGDGTSEVSAAAVAGSCVPPSVTITGLSAVCLGGSVTLDAGAGFSSYFWTPGNFTTRTINVSPSGTTTYTVTVTDGSGCANSDTHVVTVNSAPPVAISGPTTSCPSTSVTLTATGGFAGYLWQPGNLTGQTVTVTPSSPGTTYTVTATDGNGCTSTTSHTVTVTGTPAVAITGPATSCDTNSVTLTATGGFTSYLWQPGNLTGQTITVTPSSPSTTYTLTATAAGGCTATASHTVTVNNSTPASITAGGPTTFCTGGSVTLTATAGASYLWSPGGQTSQSITVTTGGTYGVAVTAANGCVSNATPVTVTVNSAPPVAISGPTTSCPSSSVTLTATAGFAGYLWQPGNLTGQTVTVTPSSPGTTYTVTATDGNGCTSTTSHTVTVTSTPAVAITGPATSCDTNSVTLTATGGFTSYLWQPGNLTGQTITVTPSSPSTTYTLTATAAGGCTATASHTVTVNNSTPASITAGGPTTFCTGGSVTLTATAGASYVWSPGGQTSQSITVTDGGTYGVAVTGANGCVSNATPVTVTVNSAPPVAISGPTTSCPSSSVTLTATAGFAGYLWQPGNLTGQTVTVTPSAPGTTYTLTATDANGCTTTAAHTVAVTGTPAVAITGPATSCASSSITLTATGGFTSYLWQPGNLTGQTITVTPGAPSTTYTVTATAAGGCTATASHTVTVTTPAPATATAAGPTTFCAGGSVVLTASAGASYQWLPSGETTQSITVTTGGTYSVVVTDAGGCSSTSNSITVTVNPAPAVNITGPTATCANTAVTLDAGPGATFLWSPGGQTTQTITVTPSATTTYGVTVTNASGCSATDTHTVTVTSSPTATITAPTAVCAATTASASVGITSGATYNWSITNGTITAGNGTPSITFQPTGAAAVQLGVSVASGSCTATGSASVQVSPTPPTPVITAPSPVPANSSGHVAGITPEAGAIYAWSITNGTIDGPANGPSVTFSVQGTSPVVLGVTVNVNGCLATASKSVTVDNIPPQPDQADLAVTKSAPASVTTGATFTYTIGVSNNGPKDAVNLFLSDALPAGVTLLGFDSGVWSCGTSASQINCTLPSLGAGAFTVITLSAQAPSQAGTIVNTVSVASALADPDESNNSDSASTNVVAPAPTCPAGAPSLVSPANGATVTSPVTLSWSAVTGATTYDVWTSIDGVLTLAGSTSGTSLTVNAGSGTTSWYVVAHGAGGCTSLTSATRTFTVAPATNCSSRGKPQITAPAQQVVSSPVTLSWTPVPQAIGYRVWISVDGTALQDIGTTDGAISLTANLPPGRITAFVDALFNGCPPTRSEGVSFDVAPPDPCNGRGAATLVAPADNATVSSSSVELRWSAAPALNGIAPQYRVWTSVDGQAPEVRGTTPETSLRTLFERGQVVWYVQTLYPGCPSTESARFTFTIPDATNCGTARPEPLAPNNTTVANANVTFTWTSVPGAIGYELYLALGRETPALIGTVPAGTTSFNYIVPAGELTWFVRALVDRCPSRDSNGARFTYTPPAACTNNDRPVHIAPLGGTPVTSPVDFSWAAAGAARFELYLQRAGQPPTLAASTTAAEANGIVLQPGNYQWFVRAFYANCSPLDSAAQEITIVNPPPACAALTPPIVSAPGQISSGVSFLLQWTSIPGATSYQLQLSASDSFADAETITTTATQHELVRTNNGVSPAGVYARVRAIDSRCAPPTVTSYGLVSAVFILPQRGPDASTPLAKDVPVTHTINLGPQFAGQSFVATPNQPWLSVTPSSGVVAAGGTSLLVTASTTTLDVGTNLGAVTVTLSTPSSGIRTAGTTTVSTTVSVNLVTPVTPAPKNTPPPDALIIPAVANADGINSRFQSDVRVSNTSPQIIKYQLSFTPSGEAGITAGRQTTFSIEPGRTVALDDILKSWFGTGSASITGTLEVRPLTQTSTTTSGAAFGALANLVTFASSRTFNVTPNGTFGQHIPAIPYANFIDKSAVLSLQQIAQSAKYRTNLGLVEGSGESANLLIKVFGSSGSQIAQFPVALKGGQHTQMNSVLAQHGINDLTDGRIEVQVLSGNGKVTAYASVLDNQTSDPLLVSPVTLTQTGNRKWVVPGVADLNNGVANWQTDLRIFNAGTTDVSATLSFYSQNGGEPKTASVTIPAGQVRTLDKTLATVFGATNDGGAVHITTTADARLIATARTYNQTTGGTYGQFISAVTPAEAAAAGTRPLQLLQVEESDRFRSNIGLAEVTGNPVTVEISIIPPDAKFTAVARLELGANEFRQIGSLLRAVGFGDTYNARVTVRVVEGTGRVAAYASVIDMETNDPTYVPAQ